MIITTHSKGLVLTDEEKAYIQTKVETLAKYADRIKDDSSELRTDIVRKDTKSSSDAVTCVITMTIPKSTLRAEAHGALVKEAFDLAKPKLKQQIDTYKEKIHHGSATKTRKSCCRMKTEAVA